MRIKFPVDIMHCWQENRGFRKASIMNHAVSQASGDYIIQIDGDMLTHPRFIADHSSEIEKGVFVRGSRALIDPSSTARYLQKTEPVSLHLLSPGIRNRLNAFRHPLLSKIISKKMLRSDNVHGSNCAYWKKDFVAVNGYNNEMQGWGHEDIELAARFTNAGIQQKKLKMKANAFHLHHEYQNRERAGFNYGIYMDTVESGRITCRNGYLQIIEHLQVNPKYVHSFH